MNTILLAVLVAIVGVIVLALVINNWQGVAGFFGTIVGVLLIILLFCVFIALFAALCFGSVWLAIWTFKLLAGVFA